MLVDVSDADLFRAYRPIVEMAAAVVTEVFESRHFRRQAQLPGRRPADHIERRTQELQRANEALAAEVSARIRTETALKFLAEASVALAESLDCYTTLSRVAQLAIPDFADWCLVDLAREDGTAERVEVAHADPEQAPVAAALRRHEIELRDNQPYAPVGALTQRRSVLIEEVTDAQLCSLVPEAEHRKALRATGVRSMLSAPLVARGRALGVLSFGRTGGERPYGQADLAIAEQLAHRAALSIENARLFLEATQKSASLQAASRTKDEFLAMLGHELRNPLSPILTAVQLMRLRRDPDTFAKEREIIERQTRHLMRLVDDLLDVSRITRGKVTLDRKPMELGMAVSKAVETVSPLLEERGHRLTTRVAGAGLAVEADEHRLAQIISNLLTNAAKYTEPGGSIEIAAERQAQWVVLRVKDNGMGIDEGLLPRIFDQFFQGQRGLDRSEGGLGLGLAIVRSLVEMHNGVVAAHSDGPGKGSEFVLRLPSYADGKEASASRPPSSTGRAESVLPKRILVVDDNRDAAEILAAALEEEGHVVHATFDAPSALRVAEELKPEVALLDIGLPVMDGYELGRRLRQLPDLNHIRLIAVTGYGQEADRARSREAGFHEHLVKPIDLDDVVRALESEELATSQ